MSKMDTGLKGAPFTGFVTVSDTGPCGMITLRGDLGDAKLQKACTDATGAKFPEKNEIRFKGNYGLAWASPDEIFVFCPYDQASEVTSKLQNALSGIHHLAANVSDARVILRIEGTDIRDAIGKLTPANVSPEALQPGQFRRTRLAQIPAGFWMRDDTTIELMCFRSVGQYAFDILKSAATPGSEVGFH